MISNAIFLNASINKDRDFNQFKSNRFGKEKSRDSENNFENFGIFHKIRNCLGGNESKYKRFKNEVAEIRICIGCGNLVAPDMSCLLGDLYLIIKP